MGAAVWAAVQQLLRAVADTYHVVLPFRHVLKGLAMVFYNCKLGNIYGSFGHAIRHLSAKARLRKWLARCSIQSAMHKKKAETFRLAELASQALLHDFGSAFSKKLYFWGSCGVGCCACSSVSA
jgi:hypothetical protein